MAMAIGIIFALTTIVTIITYSGGVRLDTGSPCSRKSQGSSSERTGLEFFGIRKQS